jgi:AcrR family transcriptional regulator
LNSPIALDRRVRKSRQALRSALQALLMEKPIEQITLQEITERADLAYTTFFRNYADKDALLEDLAQSQIDRLLDLTMPLFSAKDSSASTLTLCEYVREHDQIWTVLLTGGAVANVRRLFVQRVDARADQWPAQPGWLPPSFGTTILSNITLDILALWLERMPEAPPADIAAMLTRFFRVLDDD